METVPTYKGRKSDKKQKSDLDNILPGHIMKK